MPLWQSITEQQMQAAAKTGSRGLGARLPRPAAGLRCRCRSPPASCRALPAPATPLEDCSRLALSSQTTRAQSQAEQQQNLSSSSSIGVLRWKGVFGSSTLMGRSSALSLSFSSKLSAAGWHLSGPLPAHS